MSTAAPPTAAPPTASSTPEAILARQAARESAARTYARSLPIVPVRARGMTIEGADGRRYLDCLSGAGSLALGHNHPVVLEAIRRVLDSGAPLHALDLATPIKDAFTSELFATLPPEFARQARIQFCGPAGTDAVEAAIKLARTATGRSGLLAFTGAYHGMTAGALAATGDTAVRAPLGAGVEPVTRLPYPYDYRCPFGVGGAEGARLAARWTRTLLDDPKGGVLPSAAMLVEPVQGEGGVIPGPDPWLRELRRITAERGIPLIVDEVQTGVGRTGAFWAIEHSGVVPDVLVVSKAVGGSLPLAAVLYREDLDVWRPGAHAGTFRGNQLAMAAGAATLRQVREEGLAARAATLGRRLLDQLRELQERHPAVGDVRGRGLMLGMELVEPEADPDDSGARPPSPGLATAVQREALRRGLIVELGGREGSVIRLLPPLITTDEQAQAVVDRLADALGAAEGAGRPAQAGRPARQRAAARPGPGPRVGDPSAAAGPAPSGDGWPESGGPSAAGTCDAVPPVRSLACGPAGSAGTAGTTEAER